MITRAQPTPTILNRCPVVPVVVLDDPADAQPLGEALLAGGIDIVEITLRTPAGLDAIRRLADMPGLHVGAGPSSPPSRSTRSSTPVPGSSSAPAYRARSSSDRAPSTYRLSLPSQQDLS